MANGYQTDNPCKYCVPPKRHIGCHSTCLRFCVWEILNYRKLELERLDSVAFVSDHEFERRRECITSSNCNKKRAGNKKSRQ